MGLLTQSAPPAVETLAEHIYIGQVYPSGNVYVRAFSDTAPSRWPTTISVVGLGDGQRALSRLDRATFARELDDAAYIPGVEGMDEDHVACGAGVIRKANPAHEVISGDFFFAMYDHCEPNDGFAVYRSTPSNYSALVIAVDSAIELTNARVIVDGPLRPVTAAERQEIEREKRELVGQECATEPQYRDTATPIFHSALRGADLSLRLSTFKTPGCGGHLSRHYILDVLRNGQPIRTFEISRAQGLL